MEEDTKYGLIPKGKGLHRVHYKNDKEREDNENAQLSLSYRCKQMYVIQTKDIQSIKSLAGLLMQKKEELTYKVLDKKTQQKLKVSLNDIVVLKIDLKGLPWSCKVFTDPACQRYAAYIIKEYIPPFVISEVKI